MQTKEGLWKLSPSGLYTFEECPGCFWIEQHVGRAPSFPMRLNDAVDEKLKNRYDTYRKKGELPPEVRGELKGMKLFRDLETLEKWRSNWTALRFMSEKDGYVLRGMVDEILVVENGKYIPADFKSSGDRPKEDKQKYYRLQLHAYALMIQENGYPAGDRSYLLHYFTKDRANPSLSMEFKAHVDKVDIDLAGFKKTLREMVSLLNEEYPGPNRYCRRCIWEEKRRACLASPGLEPDRIFSL